MSCLIINGFFELGNPQQTLLNKVGLPQTSVTHYHYDSSFLFSEMLTSTILALEFQPKSKSMLASLTFFSLPIPLLLSMERFISRLAVMQNLMPSRSLLYWGIQTIQLTRSCSEQPLRHFHGVGTVVGADSFISKGVTFRGFEISLSEYVSDGVKVSKLQCIFLNTPCWRNTPTPSLKSTVSFSGHAFAIGANSSHHVSLQYPCRGFFAQSNQTWEQTGKQWEKIMCSKGWNRSKA
ncbi:hypothetical protein C8J56DRAFT_1050586 [Mycena floridula]|nr:hypothetical protein C8J56DRAFT_1050586 [Mycena floridula]